MAYDSNKKIATFMQVTKIEHNSVISTKWYLNIALCCTAASGEANNISNVLIISNRLNVSANPD